MRSLLIGLLLVLFCAGAIACGRDAPEPKADSETVSGWHIVGAGETLSSISDLFYDDPQYWYHLKKLNVELGVLENSSLGIGDRLYIPNAQRNSKLLTVDEAGTIPKVTRLNSFSKA